MNVQLVEPAIEACLTEIHTKLREAERIATAALACAQAGAIAKSIQVSMDIEQIVYEVGRLHDAACLLGRLAEIKLP